MELRERLDLVENGRDDRDYGVVARRVSPTSAHTVTTGPILACFAPVPARLFRSRLEFLLAPAAVVGFALLIWRLFCVTVGDGTLFVAYVAAYTLIPGCAVFVALTRPERLTLREFALGWGLGYGLEVGFFALTAATGTRDLFALYPVAVVLVTAPWTFPLLRATLPSPPPGKTGSAWASRSCPARRSATSRRRSSPRRRCPGMHRQSAITQTSSGTSRWRPRHSIIGRWMCRAWPVCRCATTTSPTSTPPQPARSRYLPLSLMLLRLTMVPLTVLAVAQFVVLTRSLGGSAWAGMLAAGMFMLAAFPEPLPSVPSLSSSSGSP